LDVLDWLLQPIKLSLHSIQPTQSYLEISYEANGTSENYQNDKLNVMSNFAEFLRPAIIFSISKLKNR
jgi:hypothetical protein